MVEQLTTRTAKLIPRAKKVRKVPGFATSYHFETDTQLEVERGNLYIVIEALTGAKQAEEVADLVIETVGNAYFNTKAKPDETTLTRFEEAIKATNQALASYTNNGNASWVGRLSAVITVLCGDELHLTQAGSAEAYLYRGNRTSHITADLQPKGIQKPVNTFSNIASGTVQPSDRLVIGTPALFHQVGSDDLKSLITDSTANGAITKISERVGADDDAERIAAIVIEITTPEMLALSTLPDEPEEVHIGKPDSPLEVAKTMATPAAISVANKGRQVGQKVVHHARTNLVPRLRDLGLAAAGWLRSSLKQQRTRQIVAGVLIVLVGFWIWSSNGAAKTKAVNAGVTQYISSFQTYEQAVAESTTDKAGARSSLESLSKDLDRLAGNKYRKDIDAKLAKRGRQSNDPSSIDGLKTLIATQIDSLNGIVTAIPTVLSDLSPLASKPTNLELVGTTYVMADNEGSITTFVPGNAATVIVSKPNGFGSLVATTASTNNDGIYLLTTEPAVWFFNVSTGSMTKQTAVLDGWVRGKAIASYSGNLYILAEDASQVWKYVKTSSGFSAKSAYFGGGVSINDSVALAVDGSVYLAGPNGIHRYTKGLLDQSTADVPENLKQPIELQVAGTTILTRDGKSSRIGVFTAPDNVISYSEQITLKDIKAISGVRIDAKGTTIYAIADDKLISATLE